MCLETDVVRILTSCPNSMQVPEYFEKGFKGSAQVEPLRGYRGEICKLALGSLRKTFGLRMGIAFSYGLRKIALNSFGQS